MSFTYGFYNSDGGDRRYTAEQFGMMFDGLIGDGIYEHYKNAMRVRSSEEANKVIVKPGRGWFHHTWCYVDVDTLIDAPEPEAVSGKNRIDALVIDIDVMERTNSLLWVHGPAQTGSKTFEQLTKPTLINTDVHEQHPLCYIIRYGGVNTITQADIQDQVGRETPYVFHIIEPNQSVEDIVAQWEDAFERWMAASKTEFDEWFDNLHYILDGDVAGHLQNEIDSIDIVRNGTASSTEYSAQNIVINGSSLGTVDGTMYMEQSVTLLTSEAVSCTFTNNKIRTATSFNVRCSDPSAFYTDISLDDNTVTLTFDKVATQETITVRLYLYEG